LWRGRKGEGIYRTNVKLLPIPPVSDCIGRPVTYTHAYVTVRTVLFDTNNHEAN